ncbi:hypothetical protein [Enterobacter asburiae]|uniref:hypothetical protein n=1 Tax=Enterobacter asburiae TaxID=61645 RepID=UPI003F5686BC
MRTLTVVQGLEILASWLEDNIGCETELCFDNPEDGTDSAMLLPCVEAALAMIKYALNPAEMAGGGLLHLRAQGEANDYALLKGGDWFARVLMNGAMTHPQQEAFLQSFVTWWNNGQGGR